MVQMRVGQDDCVNLGRRYRRVLPVALAPFFVTLKQPTINKNLKAILSAAIYPRVDQVFRTCDRAGGAEKLNVGQESSPSMRGCYLLNPVILNVLFVISISGTLPSFTTTS